MIKQTGADISEEVDGIGPCDPFVALQQLFPRKVTEFMQIKFITVAGGSFSATPGRAIDDGLIVAFYSGTPIYADCIS